MEVTSLLPRTWTLCIMSWILVLVVALGDPGGTKQDRNVELGLGITELSVENTALCHDGVLATQQGRARALAGRWSILVTLDVPSVPDGLKQGIHQMVHFANQVKVAPEVKDSWFRRLNRLQQPPLINTYTDSLFNSSQAIPSSSPTRNKRGWLDPVGELFHTIIGVATDSQLKHVNAMIEEIQGSEETIVHKVDELTSIVNRSRLYEAENRNFLNKLADRFRHVQLTLDNTTTEINKLQLMVSMERILEELEIKGDILRQMRSLFAHRQQDLQARTLTPELLPALTLRTILGKISSYEAQALNDLNWYYSFAQARPMWAEKSSLVYEIEIPLVRPVKFLLYDVQSWPVPISGDLSAIIKEGGRYAYDSNSGQLFEAQKCKGARPQICMAGALYGINAPPCIRGILKGDQSLMGHCHLSMVSGNATKLYHLHDNVYILTTWGESLTAICSEQNVKTLRFTRGTYRIVLPPSCSVNHPDWTIRAILRHHLDYHLITKTLYRSHPLNLTSLLQPHLKHYFPEPPMAALGRVAPVSIATLKGLRLSKEHWTDTLDAPTGVLGTVMLLGVFLTITYCLWIQREKLRKCRPKPVTKDQLEMAYVESVEVPRIQRNYDAATGKPGMSEQVFQGLLQSLRVGETPKPTAPSFHDLRLQLAEDQEAATGGERIESV